MDQCIFEKTSLNVKIALLAVETSSIQVLAFIFMIKEQYLDPS